MGYSFKLGKKQDAFELRYDVFVVEQGFANEFDAIDDICTFITMYDDETCIGCARLYREDDPRVGVLGRIALRKEYRGKHLGSEIVKQAEEVAKEIGVKEIKLHAQLNKLPFYHSLGYQEYGEIELDEFMEHQWMKKEL